MARRCSPASAGSACRERLLRCVIQLLVLCVVLTGTWLHRVDAAPAEQAAVDVDPGHELETLPRIEIHVVGSRATSEALERLLGTEVRGRARIVWSSLSTFDRQQILARLPAGGARIHCWIDLTEHGLAHLYFVAPTLDRFMMRDLAIEQLGSFEFESLAQIIETSLDALLTDEQAGISRQQAQSILNPPTSAPQVPKAKGRQAVVRSSDLPRVRFAVAGHYEATRYSSATKLQHGPGISLGIERLSASALQTIALSSSFHLPRRVRNETASMSLGYASLSLELAQLWALGAARQHHLGPSVGLGIAEVQATPFAGELPGSYALLPRARTLEYHLSSGLSWRIALQQWLSLQLALKFRLVPKPLRHEFLVDGHSQVITEGLYFRPVLELAVFVH